MKKNEKLTQVINFGTPAGVPNDNYQRNNLASLEDLNFEIVISDANGFR